MQCTLIIATYNWPEALALCLKSVLAQTVLPGKLLLRMMVPLLKQKQ